MLKNASSLAIVGLDTAENGPSKVRQVTNRIEAIIVSIYASASYELFEAVHLEVVRTLLTAAISPAGVPSKRQQQSADRLVDR